ncbi:hypothetical protein HPB47_018604, partial [Ixodes persulcatus]
MDGFVNYDDIAAAAEDQLADHALVLIRGTSEGLRVYCEAKHPELVNSEDTEASTRTLNDMFDALNIKLPSKGIRKNSKELKIIKDFLELLSLTEQNSVSNNTKLFASQMTTESTRSTLMSTLNIIEYLLNQGAHY